MIRAVSRVCWASLYWFGIAVFAVFAVGVLALRYWLLPTLPNHRADIELAFEKAIGTDVSLGGIQGAWQGLRPVLKLTDVAINDKTGKPALSLDRVDVTLSWWTFATGLPKLHEVELVTPELRLRRDKDGRVYFADVPLAAAPGEVSSGRFLDWLLDQPHLSVRDARLEWHDEYVGAPVVRLHNVNILMDRVRGRHLMAMQAVPQDGLARSIDVRLDIQAVRHTSAVRLDGTVFVQLENADIATIKRHLPYAGTQMESMIASARGSVRAWVTLIDNQPKEMTVDVAARDVRMRLGPDVTPLAFATFSARGAYREDTNGGRIALQGLDFVTDNGLRNTSGGFRAEWQRRAKAPAANAAPLADVLARIQVDVDRVDVAVVSALIEHVPLERGVRDHIRALQARGVVHNAMVDFRPGANEGGGSLTTRGRVEGLSINPGERHPGVEGLTAEWTGDDQTGTVTVASNAFAFRADDFFAAPLRFDRVNAVARWSRPVRTPQQIASPGKAPPATATPAPAPHAPLRVDIEHARVESRDVTLEVKGAWQSLPIKDGQSSPGWVDLQGTVLKADLGRIHTLMPNGIKYTRAWLARNLTQGKVDAATFALKGDLWHFPFADNKHGEFKVDARYADTDLKFLPDWPAATDVRGTLTFRNAQMNVVAERAQVSGLAVEKATASILLAGAYLLKVDVDASPPAREALRVLRETPLRETAGAIAEAVQINGSGKLNVGISMPMLEETNDRLRIDGRYRFTDMEASLSPNIRMQEASGEIRFAEDGIRTSEINGQMFGRPLLLALSPTAEGVRLVLDGRVDSGNLSFLLSPTMLSLISGETAWRATFLTTARTNVLRIESNLTGLSSKLPAPLAKANAEAMNLLVDVTGYGTAEEMLRVRLAERVNVWLYRDFSGPTAVIRSARVQLGTPSAMSGARPPEPAGRGLWISGSLPFVDYDEWRRTTRPSAGAAAVAPADADGMELNGLDITTGRIRFFGHEYTALNARLTRQASVWSGRIASPDFEGDVTWDGSAAGGRGALRADLTRFHFLPEPVTTQATPISARNSPTVASQAPPDALTNTQFSDLPALDIRAQSFRFRQQWLGALELKATPLADEWRIDRFAFVNGHAQFAASGAWRVAAGASRTRLVVSSDVTNLNALFAQFGHGDALKRGSATLKGELSWAGFPHDFALTKLDGDLRMEWRDGQFAKLEPGFGKLLGLISLQSVPRRFTLDFRDVFSEGFAFDRIAGDIKLNGGIMSTQNFEIAGPAAFVVMQGDISLPAETQNLKVRVVPEVGEGIAIAATLIGTPVIGLTTLLVQRLLQNPLNRIVAYEYTVTGSWDNPVMTRSGAPPPAAPATAAATAGATTTRQAR
jgi:uncharacterized protein YhdP